MKGEKSFGFEPLSFYSWRKHGTRQIYAGSTRPANMVLVARISHLSIQPHLAGIQPAHLRRPARAVRTGFCPCTHSSGFRRQHRHRDAAGR